MTKHNLANERKMRSAAYREAVPVDLADKLYDLILEKMVVEKKYRDKTYNAQKLAKELGTNSRNISAVVNLRFGMNYPSLVNEYRVREAKYLLIDKRYADTTIEGISSMVGFSNRQSFYSAFFRLFGTTPNVYRQQCKQGQSGKE